MKIRLEPEKVTEIENATTLSAWHAPAGVQPLHACEHGVQCAFSGHPEGIDPGVLGSSRDGAQFELAPGDIDSARLVP